MTLSPSPVSHPLGPPLLSGNDLTVDLMLDQPTRVTRYISDISLQLFITDKIFASAGGVTGGAVVYDQAALNEIYLSRDVQRIDPGMEFPELTAQRNQPKLAAVEKWGGKVKITDEARERNDTVLLQNELRQLSNTIVRKIDQRSIAELEASLALNTATQVVAGNNWQDVVTVGSSASNAVLWPAADFANIQMLADHQELGVVIDLWLMNPQETAQLGIIYGNNLTQVLQAHKIQIFSSNRVTPGTAYALAQGQVGQMRVEKPLGTETWREQSKELTWVQASVRPVVFVTNPFSVFKVIGLAG